MAYGSDKRDKMLVAALEIGDTHSCYAFSLKSEYNQDPSKVTICRNWVAGSMSLISRKTPTCVLFDENQEFHSFGFEAENFYADLALDGEHEKWHFFKRFKMCLHSKTINRDVEVEDDRGRKMSANKVFGAAIRYLKDHLLDWLKKRAIGIVNKDIHWVLTVPAIWPDFAKQFMREAAYLADIDGSQLSIVTEPEAASLYAQMLPVDKIHGFNGATFDVASPGSKFMVIDLGGNKADFTIHERQADGGLRELHHPEGGPWGGTRVDAAFFKLLIKVVGVPVFKKFTEENDADHLGLQRQLEYKKRTITSASDGKIMVKVPISLASTYEDETDERIRDAIEQSPYKGQIHWMGDKLRINADVFKGLFKECADNIVNKIQELLKDPKVKGTNIFLMVGGFSECTLIQDAIRKSLPNGKIIIPEEAGLAVLKGAVIFGHQPVAVTRVCSRRGESQIAQR